jgi:uncharacterized protein (TIGR00661 family)
LGKELCPLLLKKNKKIFICPLDWGLGHATRCIPVIEKLRTRGIEVLIGADKGPFEILKSYFPDIRMVRFPGYEIQYPENNRMAFKILRSLPSLRGKINLEHRKLLELQDKYHFNAVISDNRFGLSHSSIPCVYMTHQVMIKAARGFSFLEPLIHRMHKHYIKKFDECWIPDHAGKDNLSGDLAHRYPAGIKTRFIGPLSRFSIKDRASEPTEDKEVKLLVILSGPEPQRSIFEKIVLEQLKDVTYKTIVVLGLPGRRIQASINENVDVHAHLGTGRMKDLLSRAENIVCRPGYSSIMDLYTMKKTAWLVATPGQTEQEYLAGYMLKKGFRSQSQGDFDINEVMAAGPLPGWDHEIIDSGMLDRAIDDLIHRI